MGFSVLFEWSEGEAPSPGELSVLATPARMESSCTQRARRRTRVVRQWDGERLQWTTGSRCAVTPLYGSPA